MPSKNKLEVEPATTVGAFLPTGQFISVVYDSLVQLRFSRSLFSEGENGHAPAAYSALQLL